MSRALTGVHICFDLDGTLIASQLSITAALNEVLRVAGLPEQERVPVGAPLHQMIMRLCPDNQELVESLATEFKSIYDSYYCVQAEMFPEVAQGLEFLREQGALLTVVTNKRRYPAMRIIEHHSLGQYFGAVLGSDSGQGEKYANLVELAPEGREANIYVGDSVSDMIAAQKAGYAFIRAEWGYEQFTCSRSAKNMMECINICYDIKDTIF